MSIDARVRTVIVDEEGGGALRLIDRPARKSENPGIAGQSLLAFDSAPEEVTALNGLDIWGGDSSIMLGEIEIARRQGYTRIVFCDRERFIAAIKAYHDRAAS